MGRLTIFSKGNLDVRDSLHSYRRDGKVLWNGIGSLARATNPGASIRVRHETWTRSDALLETSGTPPDALVARGLPLGPYSAESQFSRAVLEPDSDVVVLSIQPDLTTQLVRHRRDGYLFYPHDYASWPVEDRRWLRDEFAPEGLLDVETSMGNLRRIIELVRTRSLAPILVYNVSPICPGEWIHCYQGLPEGFSIRARRFNLALTELSRETGISIVDVEEIVARAGADRLKIDPVHLDAEGARLTAEVVLRILHDSSLLSSGEGTPFTQA